MFGFGDNCRRIRRLLSDRVDEPLSSRNERRVAAHLAVCHECRREYDFYCDLKEAAAEMESIAPPAYLWERIALHVDEHPWGEGEPHRTPGGLLARFWAGNIGYIGTVASIVLILLIGLRPAGGLDNTRDKDQSVAAEGTLGEDLEFLSVFMIFNGDRFPAELRDYYIRHAENLDQQIRTIKSALARYPNNQQMQAQLAIAYDQKIRLYHEVESASLGRGAVTGESFYDFDEEDRYYE